LEELDLKSRKSCYPFLVILISKSLTWIFENLEQHLSEYASITFKVFKPAGTIISLSLDAPLATEAV
jgi:hypothetical protein